MKERPILFSTPMVRAILDGTKTQTRRVIKPQPEHVWGFGNDGRAHVRFPGGHQPDPWIKCPYGAAGDHLWVRETWLEDRVPFQLPGEGHVHYRANNVPVVTESWSGHWRPSIYMPRWASRIILEITEVRVERLQDISPLDALREGIRGTPGECIEAYRELWDSINGKKHPWGQNPFVWVLTFKRVTP